LRKELDALTAAYEIAAGKLSARRREAARRLGKNVETELAALAMDKTRVEIRVSPAGWSERGADAVEFLIAPNLGEEPKPLDKIASGGELSRVALALKTCVSGKSSGVPRTLVFDEVDAGVGGSAAEAVGRRLKKLASNTQVICVTHLPQIAGFADHHYSVSKHTVKGRTVASIEELTPDARTQEIGRMLSGERITPEALRHAQQLLKMAAK
jgi:DNA repair protein RecN (Recombination protein N)